MTDTYVKIPKITGSSDKEDMEEDVDAAGKGREDEVNMNETCQLEKKIKDNIKENAVPPEGENPKDHKFIRMKVGAMLTWVAETCNELNKIRMQ